MVGLGGELRIGRLVHVVDPLELFAAGLIGHDLLDVDLLERVLAADVLDQLLKVGHRIHRDHDRLVEAHLVSLLDDQLSRTGIGRDHQNVEVRGPQLQHGRSDVGDRGADQLDHELDLAVLGLELRGFEVPGAVGVVVVEVADLLAGELLGGELHHRAAHGTLRDREGAEDVGLRRIERAVARCVQHEPGNARADDVVLAGYDRRRARAAIQHEDLVLLDKLLDRRHKVVGVAAVVLQNYLDLAPVDPAFLVDLVVVHAGGVHDVEAVGHRGPRKRAEHADLDRGRVRPGSWAKTGATVASMPAAIIAAFAKMDVLDIDYLRCVSGKLFFLLHPDLAAQVEDAMGEGSSLQRGELLHAITTIHVDSGAGDVGSLWRGQESDRCGDVARLADAPERHVSRARRSYACAAGCEPHHVRLDHSRRDHVGGNPEGRCFAREGFGEADHRRLGGDVSGTRVIAAELGSNGREGDDAGRAPHSRADAAQGRRASKGTCRGR